MNQQQQSDDLTFLRRMIDEYFPHAGIDPETAVRFTARARTIAWAPNPLCGCARCRSPYQQYVTLSRTVTLYTTDGVYSTLIPAHPQEYEHVYIPR